MKDRNKKILCIFGTRPEAIKMCPLVNELKMRKEMKTVICITGQHREMLWQVLDCFNIVPDYNLSVMKNGQNLFDITVNILSSLKEVLEKEMPHAVLVHGDTCTAFSAAVCAYYLHIPVGHVEAGLRTYNIYSPFPEELYRQAIGLIARYHFSPTQTARDNLLREGKDASSIFVTGNTAIDALKTTIKQDYVNQHLSWAEKDRLIILTAHRRENLGGPLENIFRAVKQITEDFDNVKVIYPVHMNPAIRQIAAKILGDCRHVRLIEPLDVVDFHNFLARSYLILTDSGGIQEEAPFLGKPVLVLRDTTERPEGIAAGTLKLVGTSSERIYRECRYLLSDADAYRKMSHAVNPYGDGTACRKIADILEKEIKNK